MVFFPRWLALHGVYQHLLGGNTLPGWPVVYTGEKGGLCFDPCGGQGKSLLG
jgi:hypothetical protein